MTKNEMVIEVLTSHSCLTSKEIANFIWKTHNEIVTPSSVSGTFRTMYKVGAVGKSKNLNGNSVYWMNDGGKNAVKVNKYEVR